MVEGRLLFAQVNNCPDLDWEERKLNADQEPPNYVEKDDWNSKLHSFIHIILSLCSLLLIILNIWLYKYCVWNSLSAWGNRIVDIVDSTFWQRRQTISWYCISLVGGWDKVILILILLLPKYLPHFPPQKCTLYDFDYSHIATCHSHMTVYFVLCSMSWSTSIAPCNCADTIRRHCPRSLGWLIMRVSKCHKYSCL